MRDELAALEGADDQTVARQSHQLVSRYEEALERLKVLRREALERLKESPHPSGGGIWTYKQLGELVGLSPERVRQLITFGSSPERVLLGTGMVIRAVATKPEAPRVNPSRAVITEEMAAASRVIAGLAESFGLKSEEEWIYPSTLVNLNRSNLVVFGSPRLHSIVGQILEADPNFRFAEGASGWYLTEYGRKRKSPADSGEHSDYAYLGRLPRPDSRGTFLYIAGIHAPGTVGAASYFATHISEIFAQVGRRKWSVLLRCDYDPDTRKVLNVEPITPIHTF